MEKDKNQNILSWSEAFGAMTQFISLRTNPKFKPDGAIITTRDYSILGGGYCGLPRGVEIEKLDPSIDINKYLVSAVTNAIYLINDKVENSRLFCLNFPSSSDIKSAIQKGVDIIYYMNDRERDDDYIAALNMLGKRTDYYQISLIKIEPLDIITNVKERLNWDQLFVGLAKILSMRSKDPNTQVGACLVTPDKKILSIGYNGLPIGNDDNNFPWTRSAEKGSDTKYPYVVHAEHNTISMANGKDLSSSELYVNLFPCSNCAKIIIQSGVRKIYYTNDKYHDTEDAHISRILFDNAGVKYTKIPDIEIEVKSSTKVLKR